MQHPLLIAILFLLTGCGSYFPPSPTIRTVVVSDLVGRWAYQPLTGGDADILLELRRDGSYTQTVTLPRGQTVSSGSWRIDGTSLTMDAVLSNFDNWQVAQVESWRIIDRDESPAGFAILGGASDPDQWVILRFKRPHP